MPEFEWWGKVILGIGAVLVVAGLVIILGAKFGLLGRLPGDIVWSKGNFTVFIPLASSIIISIILTVLINLFWRR